LKYDSWYWHGGRESYDKKRDDEMLQAGWKIIRIKPKEKILSLPQLQKGLQHAGDGSSKAFIEGVFNCGSFRLRK
jgi:hypothetical protein